MDLDEYLVVAGFRDGEIRPIDELSGSGRFLHQAPHGICHNGSPLFIFSVGETRKKECIVIYNGPSADYEKIEEKFCQYF